MALGCDFETPSQGNVVITRSCDVEKRNFHKYCTKPSMQSANFQVIVSLADIFVTCPIVTCLFEHFLISFSMNKVIYAILNKYNTLLNIHQCYSNGSTPLISFICTTIDPRPLHQFIFGRHADNSLPCGVSDSRHIFIFTSQ